MISAVPSDDPGTQHRLRPRLRCEKSHQHPAAGGQLQSLKLRSVCKGRDRPRPHLQPPGGGGGPVGDEACAGTSRPKEVLVIGEDGPIENSASGSGDEPAPPQGARCAGRSLPGGPPRSSVRILAYRSGPCAQPPQLVMKIREQMAPAGPTQPPARGQGDGRPCHSETHAPPIPHAPGGPTAAPVDGDREGRSESRTSRSTNRSSRATTRALPSCRAS